jgi:hypothetical protein
MGVLVERRPYRLFFIMGLATAVFRLLGAGGIPFLQLAWHNNFTRSIEESSVMNETFAEMASSIPVQLVTGCFGLD